MQLESFLQSKGLEYAPFDPARATKILSQLNLKSNPKQKIIQIIGTNGKGSTGRFLALMLHSLGISVGHFTSPHLLKIHERFWINGKEVSDSILNDCFLKLDKTKLQEASYFEILTFLAKVVFNACEVVILEAGLGGEYDSTTTCFKRDVTLFSSISYDHQEVLGSGLEEIATTKLNAMQQNAILGFQEHKEVIEIAKKIANQKNINLEILTNIPDTIAKYIKAKKYASYQAQNLSLAYAGLQLVETQIKLPNFTLESLIANLLEFDLKGRMQKINANIFLDVLHNVNGAKAVFSFLKNSSFSENKTILIYNSYKDKNPKEILRLLKPLVKRVEILQVQNLRILEKEMLEKILKELEIPFCDFIKIDPKEKYLVCGSFSVVAEFLRQYHL